MIKLILVLLLFVLAGIFCVLNYTRIKVTPKGLKLTVKIIIGIIIGILTLTTLVVFN